MNQSDNPLPTPPDHKSRSIFIATVLVLITLAAFWPVTRCAFLYWDDWGNVAQNPDFNPPSLAGVAAQWTHAFRSIYMPLTGTMWQATAAISPRHPADVDGVTLSAPLFHSLNLLLHGVSVVLVFVVLQRLTRSVCPSAVGAAAFALHPVVVEPVAWMSGGKDVLSGALCLAAIHQYILFVQSDRSPPRTKLHYALGMAFFALAMLAKPAAVSLPVGLFVIGVGLITRGTCGAEAQGQTEAGKDKSVAARLGAFLCAYAPVCRMVPRSALRRAIELLPWLVLTVPIIIIGKIVQPAPLSSGTPLWARPFVVGDAIAFYLRKVTWPGTMIFDYGRSPQWLMQQGATMYLTTAATLAIIAAAWLLRRKCPALIVGIGVMIAATLPVLGFVQFDFQRYSTVSDHYLYLAMLGPAIVIAFALKRSGRPIVYSGCAIVLLAMGVRSYGQIGYWRDMATLREHEIAVNPTSPAGYRVAAYFANQKGDSAEAIRQYELALAVRPDDGETHFNLGNLLLRLNRPEDALPHFQSAVDELPDDATAANNLGIALVRTGKYEQGETSFTEAIRRDPNYADGHANLGRMMLMSGRVDRAVTEFQTALQINPNNAAARTGMAAVQRMK